MSLAQAAGRRLSPPFLSKVERGERGISAENLLHLAQRLRTPLGFLLKGGVDDAAIAGLLGEAEELLSLHRGQHAAAAAVARGVLRVVPERHRVLAARAHATLGAAMLVLGRLDRARASLGRAVRLARAARARDVLALARNRLGLYHVNLGDRRAALEQYRLALDALQEPAAGSRVLHATILMNMGLALRHIDRLEEAFDHLAEAARRMPMPERVRRGQILRALASVLVEMERYDDALAHLHEARELFVLANVPSLIAAAENGLGIWYLRRGRPREAIPYLESAAGRRWPASGTPNRGRSLTELARAYAMLKQFERALPVVTEAIQVTTGARDDEEVARAQVLRGEILMALGRAGEAAAAYAAAVPILERRERQRDLLDACVALGRALERDGQHARASEAYARALRLMRKPPAPAEAR